MALRKCFSYCLFLIFFTPTYFLSYIGITYAQVDTEGLDESTPSIDTGATDGDGFLGSLANNLLGGSSGCFSGGLSGLTDLGLDSIPDFFDSTEIEIGGLTDNEIKDLPSGLVDPRDDPSADIDALHADLEEDPFDTSDPTGAGVEGSEEVPVADEEVKEQLQTANITLDETEVEVSTLREKECSLDQLAVGLGTQITHSIYSDLAHWINSGFDGKPLFIERPGEFFKDVADRVAGRFIENAGLGFLCSPFDLRPVLEINLPSIQVIDDEDACLASDVLRNIKNAREDSEFGVRINESRPIVTDLTIDSNPTGFNQLLAAISDPYLNYSFVEELTEQSIKAKQAETERRIREDVKDGVPPLYEEECIERLKREGRPEDFTECPIIKSATSVEATKQKLIDSSIDSVIGIDEISDLLLVGVQRFVVEKLFNTDSGRRPSRSRPRDDIRSSDDSFENINRLAIDKLDALINPIERFQTASEIIDFLVEGTRERHGAKDFLEAVEELVNTNHVRERDNTLVVTEAYRHQIVNTEDPNGYFVSAAKQREDDPKLYSCRERRGNYNFCEARIELANMLSKLRERFLDAERKERTSHCPHLSRQYGTCPVRIVYEVNLEGLTEELDEKLEKVEAYETAFGNYHEIYTELLESSRAFILIKTSEIRGKAFAADIQEARNLGNTVRPGSFYLYSTEDLDSLKPIEASQNIICASNEQNPDEDLFPERIRANFSEEYIESFEEAPLEVAVKPSGTLYQRTKCTSSEIVRTSRAVTHENREAEFDLLTAGSLSLYIDKATRAIDNVEFYEN